MFAQSNPADDIQQLAEELFRQHRNGDVYRGQTQFYSPSVPSAFRPFVRELEPTGWVSLVPRATMPGSRDRFEKEKHEIKNLLARRSARGLTNVLAQQYGMASDMFDVTSEIRIAAFFATRRAPRYVHFEPAGNESALGVVYRIRVKAPPPDDQTFVQAMEQLYVSDGGSRKVFFDRTAAVPGEFDGAPQPVVEAFLREQLAGAFSIIELLKQPFYCTPELIRAMLVGHLRAEGLEAGLLEVYKDLHEMLDATRVGRQAGGILSPPLRYQGAVSQNLRALTWDNDPYWFKADPNTAIHFGVNAVFDLNRNPLVERFYFRHRAEKRVEIETLDLLWPDVSEDFLLNMMVQVVTKYFQKVRKTNDIDPFDGIIDRGYAAS